MSAESGKPKKNKGDQKIIYTRRHPRVPIEMDVEYQTGKKFIKGQSRNLSQGGIFIESSDPLNDGMETLLRFSPDPGSGHIEVPGLVVWVNKEEEQTRRRPRHQGMGVKFLGVKTREKRVIGRFVQDLTDLMRVMAITEKKES